MFFGWLITIFFKKLVWNQEVSGLECLICYEHCCFFHVDFIRMKFQNLPRTSDFIVASELVIPITSCSIFFVFYFIMHESKENRQIGIWLQALTLWLAIYIFSFTMDSIWVLVTIGPISACPCLPTSIDLFTWSYFFPSQDYLMRIMEKKLVFLLHF